MNENERVKNEQKFWEKQAASYDCRVIGFLQEYQKIIKQVKHYTRDDYTVLDVACGTGAISLEIAKYADKIEAVDISPNMIEIAKQKAKERGINNISFNIADAYHLPYSNNYFDIVILANALHVVKNPIAVLSEIRRTLKDDALLLLSVECSGEHSRSISLLMQRTVKLLGIIKYLHFYKFNDIYSLVQQAGFKIVKTEHLVNMSDNCFVVAKSSASC